MSERAGRIPKTRVTALAALPWRRQAVRTAQWALTFSGAVEDHPWVVLAALVIAYLLYAIPGAVWKPYWVDELLEYYMCA